MGGSCVWGEGVLMRLDKWCVFLVVFLGLLIILSGCGDDVELGFIFEIVDDVFLIDLVNNLDGEVLIF